MKVWAIVYGNYYPLEVRSLWISEELADKEVEQLNDDVDWRIIEMTVNEELEVKDEANNIADN